MRGLWRRAFEDAGKRSSLMKRWLLLFVFTVFLFTLAGAQPLLSTQGPIMEKNEGSGVIVVNETTIFVVPSTVITDHKGRTLHFVHLKPGRWVSVEAEPDEDSRMTAERIVLIRGK
jgi:hypothetical protein